MPPKKMQDIIAPRAGSKIPRRIFQSKAEAPKILASSKLFAHAESKSDRGSSSAPPVRHDGTSHRRFPRSALWISAIFSLFVLVFAFSTFFEKATIRVVPKQKAASFDSIIVARKGSAEGAKNTIPFEMMELRETVSKEVKATAVEKTERRASGNIIVYNDYGKESQRLIKNTRFEAPDGKMYRIHESAIVPGQTVADGKTIPGQVEVTVYADEPGESYNKGLSDFTIPGFKGTPRYDTFYARAKTEIKGGFAGEIKTVGAAERAVVDEELSAEAKDKLLASARAQKPDNFILFDDAMFVLFPDVPASPEEQNKDGVVTVSKKAVLYGILFEKNNLSDFMAGKLSYKEDEALVAVRNLEDLDFKIIDRVNFDPAEDTQFSFTLKGKPQFVWEFDDTKLREALRTIPKNELAAVLLGFPSITRAEVTFRPFWKRSFPADGENIIIEKAIDGE